MIKIYYCLYKIHNEKIYVYMPLKMNFQIGFIHVLSGKDLIECVHQK